jgi:hypothetical protein
MRPRVKIQFADFWPGFDSRDNYFIDLLSSHYELDFADDPDFLIYSVFGKDHWRYRCVRILFVGENHRPDYRFCDYAFSFDYPVTPRNYRLPLYALYGDPARLVKAANQPPEPPPPRERFCCMVVSNPFGDKRRAEFFRKLSAYKHVDSGGATSTTSAAPWRTR